MGYLLQTLGRVLGKLGHKVPREHLQWPMQMQDRPGCKVQKRATAKQGRFDQEDLDQYGSAAPAS